MFERLISWMIPLLILGFVQEDDDKEKSDKDSTEDDSEEKESDDSEESDESEEEEESDSDNENEEKKDSLDNARNLDDIDPKKLPKELQAHYRKMQGIFTRNNQRAIAVQRKAAAFDYLLEDPDFRQFLENKKSATVKSKTSKSSRRDKDDDEEDNDNEDTPVTRADLRKFMEDMRAEGEQSAQKTRFMQERDKFFKDNPLAKEFQPELKDIILKYGMDYNEAWKWLQANDEDIAEQVREHRRSAKKVLKPSRNSDTKGKEPTKKGKIKSWSDAVDYAMRQLNMKD